MNLEVKIEQGFPTNRENREDLWGKVEKKIVIAKEFWLTASTFPVPTAADKPELAEEEKPKLHLVVEKAIQAFPHAASAANRLIELQGQVPKVVLDLADKPNRPPFNREVRLRLLPEQYREYSKTGAQILDEYARLRQDDNVRFLGLLYQGMATALQTRAEVRKTLQDLGTDSLTPQAYDKLIPKKYRIFREHVKKVIVANYSIGLVIDHDAFAAYKKGAHSSMNRKMGGFYDRDGVFFYLDEGASYRGTPEERVFDAIFGTSWSKESEKVTPAITEAERISSINHENFHALFKGFNMGISMEEVGYRLRADIGLLVHLKQKSGNSVSSEVAETMKAIRTKLDEYVNTDQEETLADISTERDAVAGWVAANLRYKNVVLTKLSGSDPDIDKQINKARYALNTFAPRVRRLYKIVGKQAPEKLIDLGIAFVLFPPSKLRHVERLVDRWCHRSADIIKI